MGWNEPGNNDPWSNGGRKRPGGGQEGPPDLDEAIRKFQEQLSAMFGGGKRKGGKPSGGNSGGAGGLVGLIALLLLGAAVVSSVHIVEPAERGVVTRFGRYVDTLMPGLAFRLPWPIEQVTSVNVEEYRRMSYKDMMLTKDENLVDINLVVQYRVADPYKYLYSISNTEATVDDAIASAIREVVGKSQMDYVITEGRSELAENAKVLLQEVLDSYESGVAVISMNLSQTQAPAAVKDAFEDAIKSREDAERSKNEGEAYANDVVPKARGRATRIIEEARAYRDSLIAQAEGDSERFTKLLAEYKKAPDVTRDRLYIETIEAVFGDTNKVMVDTNGNSDQLMYLPLDKILSQQPNTAASVGSQTTSSTQAANPTASNKADTRGRQRDSRVRGDY